MNKSIVLLAIAFTAMAVAETFDARKAHVRTLLEQQAFAPALEEAKAINREWPDDIAGYQLIASAHLGLGNYTDADKALQWMLDLRIGKADAAGWLLVAQFREVTGDVDGALDAINLAAGPSQQDANRPALAAYSAHLLLLAGRLEFAETAAQTTLAGSPADLMALETMAGVRLAQHRQSDATAFARQLLRASDSPRYLYLLAEITQSPADYASFERAARERMDVTANANRELAIYYSTRARRPSEALTIARKESERRHDVFTMDALALALLANGKWTEARSAMKDVIAVGTRDPAILEHAARLGMKSH